MIQIRDQIETKTAENKKYFPNKNRNAMSEEEKDFEVQSGHLFESLKERSLKYYDYQIKLEPKEEEEEGLMSFDEYKHYSKVLQKLLEPKINAYKK